MRCDAHGRATRSRRTKSMGLIAEVEHAIVGPAGDTWRPAAVNAMGVALVRVVPASFAARLCRRGDPRAVQVICDRLSGHVGIIRRFGSTGSQRQADHRRPAINQIDADQQSRYPSRDAGSTKRITPTKNRSMMPLSTSRPQQNALNQIGQCSRLRNGAKPRIACAAHDACRASSIAHTGPRRDRAALGECRGP